MDKKISPFVDNVAGVYHGGLVLHPECDVDWICAGQVRQVLMLYPHWLDDALYRAVCWDGDCFRAFVLHQDWELVIRYVGKAE